MVKAQTIAGESLVENIIINPKITVQEIVARNKQVQNTPDQFHWRAWIRPEFREELKDLPGASEGFLDEILPKESGGKKRLYKEIWKLEKDRKISSVEWVRNDNVVTIGVHLVTGTFHINGVEFIAVDRTGNIISLRNLDYRSIAIRRRQEDLIWGIGPAGSRVIFILGWQVEVDGRSIKSPLLQSLPSGHIVFGYE